MDDFVASGEPVSGACLLFAGTVARAIHRAKRGGARRCARDFASITTRRDELGLCAMPTDVDVVTWVPADPVRGDARGAHLPELYARALARARGLDAAPLLRRAHRAPQRGRDRSVRARNVEGSFEVRAGEPALTASARVLVVDDVVTTGATLRECGDVLGRAGCGVRAFALAAVPRHRPEGARQAARSMSGESQPPISG